MAKRYNDHEKDCNEPTDVFCNLNKQCNELAQRYIYITEIK